MKAGQLFFIVGSVALALTSCAKPIGTGAGSLDLSSITNPGDVKPLGAPLKWAAVQERTTCEALNPAYCIGIYGFTVTSSGQYTVGPSPGGGSATGSITAAELAELSADANLAALTDPSSLSLLMVCEGSGGLVPGISDSVWITASTSVDVEIYNATLGSVCYRGDKSADAAVHADLRALMMKYYPVPLL